MPLLHEQDFDWSLLEDIEKTPDVPPEKHNEEDFFATAQAAIEIARDVFDRADVDESGGLDAREMSGVVIDSLRALGAQVPHDIEQVSIRCILRLLSRGCPGAYWSHTRGVCSQDDGPI